MEISKTVFIVSPGDFMPNNEISRIGREQIEHVVRKIKKEIGEHSNGGITILRGKNPYLKGSCEIIRSKLPTKEVLDYRDFSDKKWQLPSPEAVESISKQALLFVERLPREFFLFLPGINIIGQLTVQIIDIIQCRDKEVLRVKEKEKQIKFFDEPAFEISYEEGVIIRSTSCEIPDKNIYATIRQGGMVVVLKPSEREFCVK